MRCFRVKEMGRVWDAGSGTEERPDFGEADENSRMGTARKNMESGQIEFLVKQCVGNFDITACSWYSASITRRAIRGGAGNGYAESIYRAGA